MYSINNQSGHTAQGLKEYICDTEEDLQYLPIDISRPGSTALIIATSNVYMLNTKYEWISLNDGSMSPFSLPKWKGGKY